MLLLLLLFLHSLCCCCCGCCRRFILFVLFCIQGKSLQYFIESVLSSLSEFRFSGGGVEGGASTQDLGGIDADNESSPESSPSLCLNATRNPSLSLATIQEFPASSNPAVVVGVGDCFESPLTTPTMDGDDDGAAIANGSLADATVVKQKYGTFYDEAASSSAGSGGKKDDASLDGDGGGGGGGHEADRSDTGSLASSQRDSEHSGGGSGSGGLGGGGYQGSWSRDTVELVRSYQPSFTGQSPPSLSDPKPAERRTWRLLDGFKPSEIFRKLTVRDAREEAPTEMQEYNSSNSSETSPITSSVRPHHPHGGIQRADKLPQSFVVRFLGKRPCNGLWGIRNTRRPTDELVMEAKNANGGQDAPALVITGK